MKEYLSLPGPHVSFPASRRDFLLRAGAGFGGLAFAALTNASRGNVPQREPFRPLAPRQTHFPPKVQRVIWLFIDGGPSHIDLFDPKPALVRLAGKPLPPSFPRPTTAMGVTASTPLLASSRSFRRCGASGTWISDLYPEIAKVADELCVLRSCKADGQTHIAGVCQMNTGALLAGRPSVGAWMLYGLGAQCDNLPGFVVLADTTDDPPGGAVNWGTGFMPATYQGTRLGEGKAGLLYADPPAGVTVARQKAKIAYINELNHHYAAHHHEHDHVDAQIAAYELAFRMQASAPEALSLAGETASTLKRYGIDHAETARNGRNCLLARRLVERGVRFVQVYMGVGSKWDAHRDLDGNHGQLCHESDRPIAGLIKDLRHRGLLDSTLVVWGGEFGRTPMSESGNGRDHNPYGFTMWMAGGGVKRGLTFGATDEVGLYAVDKPVHVHDIHATVLRLLGLDHRELTFLHDGRDERLTVNSGRVIEDILA